MSVIRDTRLRIKQPVCEYCGDPGTTRFEGFSACQECHGKLLVASGWHCGICQMDEYHERELDQLHGLDGWGN